MPDGATPAISATEEARYRLLVEAITDYAIYMLDTDGNVVSWNAGARRFKGYSDDEILGEHFSRFYTENDRAKGLPSRALNAAECNGRYEAEGWRLRKDGEKFWAHVVIDPIRDPAGNLIGFAKITRDLSEKKAAEEAQRRNEELFRLLVEGVTDYAIYMLDPAGKVSSWNPGAERIKGYAAGDILGEHFSRFYTAQDRESGEPERALAAAAETGRFEKEALRLRKDGTEFWAHVVIDAIRSETGELLGFAKITRDITERRQAQIALEEAREALFQSQKLEAIGQLTGGIAHDFNNLLMAVLGSLALLRKRLPEDPALQRYLDNAVQGAERGAALTQRMLSFARRQSLDMQPVDVRQLVTGIKDLMERALGPSVDIHMTFGVDLPLVISDPNQLETALINLAVNARDAMPDGGTILIQAEKRAEGEAVEGLRPGPHVCLSVVDQGEGMDADTLKRAIDPFFTTKGVGKGTGLGLSMVHGLAHQSGGHFTLKSRPGFGTTAELWLPVAGDAIQSREAIRGEAPDDKHVGEILRVLAVDDDRLVLTSTAAMLEDLGHEVVEASSARQVLDILEKDCSFDLLISDHAMPRMTGTELARIIRQRWPDLPVLIATGYAELPADTPATLPRLLKPFGQEELASAVASAVSRHPATSSAH